MTFSAFRKFLAVLAAVVVVLCLGAAAQEITDEGAVYTDAVLEGRGTTANPYLVSTAKDLDLVRVMTENGETKDVCFRLESNIVLNDVNGFVMANGYIAQAGDKITAFSPIGTAETPFEGYFDGNGFYITGLYTSGKSASGLFGVVKNGKIENLNIDFALVDAKEYAGLVAGKLEGASSISNVVVSGSVIGKQQELASVVGGIAGSVSADSWIAESCSYACVAGSNAFSSNVGGIAGANYGEITECTFGGKIHGVSMYFSTAVGGICGANNGEITGCLSCGEVSGESASSVNECYVGGIAGKNTGVVGECYNKSTVSASCYSVADSICTAGGIVGYNADADIHGCQNDGIVTGNKSYAGGIAGLSFVTIGQHGIDNCLNTAEITGINGVAGGIVARASVSGYITNRNTVSASFNIGNVQGNVAGGFVGLVYAENENCLIFEDCYTEAEYPDEIATEVVPEEYMDGWALDGLDRKIWNFEVEEIPYLSYPGGMSKNISGITAQTEQIGNSISNLVSQGVGSVSFSDVSEVNGVHDVIVRYSGDKNNFAPKSVVVKFTVVAVNELVEIVDVDMSDVVVVDGVLKGSVVIKISAPGGIDATAIVSVYSDSFTGAKFGMAKNDGKELEIPVDLSGIEAKDGFKLNVMIVEDTQNISPVCENKVVSKS